MADTKLTRIGIFYDGSYFAHVSNYYLCHHERRARVSIQGLHELIRDEVGQREQTDARYCQIVEAHYFRGRFSAADAKRHDAQRMEGDSILYRERKFEDALIKAGVTPHFLPLFPQDDGHPREKGIDVWLALEAFDLARSKELDVIVLITGDGDYVPLVRKLNSLGSRVMVTAWDIRLATERFSATRTAQSLIDEVTYPVMMGAIIDDRARRHDPLVVNLFISRPAAMSVPNSETEDSCAQPEPNSEAGRPPWPCEPDADGADAVREMGYIANLPYGREFGFIESDKGGERMFFHQTWVEGCNFCELQRGDRVEYTPDTNPRDGRPVAVRIVRQPSPQPYQDLDEDPQENQEE